MTRQPIQSIPTASMNMRATMPVFQAMKNHKGMPGPGQIQTQALISTGQEPLTSSQLAEASPQEQKQLLGERLFPLIHIMYPDMAGKITGMLLEIDNAELLHMLESKESLRAKVF